MKVSVLLQRAFFISIIPAVLLTIALYNYPYIKSCAFSKDPSSTSQAPFRLLALGDPQLEGSSSLPDPNAPLFPAIQRFLNHRTTFSQGFVTERPSLIYTLKALYYRDIPLLIYTYRKRLDLFGNDYYLAHIYRVLSRSLDPTHVTVLGDLLGSQWVDDGEFIWRAWRFWERVFSGAGRVEDRYMDNHGPEPLMETTGWNRRVINVAGNHDIGYSGDITRERVERFEALFGRVNWDIRFSIPSNVSYRRNPELRLVVLNGMNMDGPAYSQEIQTETYAFLNNHIIGHARPVEDRTAATILLTHIPLDKEDGVCVDGAMFEYGPSGLRAQNQLSQKSTLPILEGIFGLNPESGSGLARNGIILTGHDHEGCDAYHYLKKTKKQHENESQFGTTRWDRALNVNSTPGVREVTVRSMMGSYGGNAGLLSAWYDEHAGEWRFEYDTCGLGVQHIWWTVHVIDLIALLCLVGARIFRLLERAMGHEQSELDCRNMTTATTEATKLLMRTTYRENSATSSARNTALPGTQARRRA